MRRSAFYEGCINHSAQRIEQIRAHKCIPGMIDRCFTGLRRDFRDLFDFRQHHLSTPQRSWFGGLHYHRYWNRLDSRFIGATVCLPPLGCIEFILSSDTDHISSPRWRTLQRKLLTDVDSDVTPIVNDFAYDRTLSKSLPRFIIGRSVGVPTGDRRQRSRLCRTQSDRRREQPGLL